MDPESAVLASRFKDSDTVELTPFRHQVGGHFMILDFDDHHLAKPVVPRELFFYQTAPKEVCTFIPRYHGEVLSSRRWSAAVQCPCQCSPLRKTRMASHWSAWLLRSTSKYRLSLSSKVVLQSVAGDSPVVNEHLKAIYLLTP